MDDDDMRVSMSNLVQMDRHQTDIHRGPMVNQEQNADAARQEVTRRLASPTEPDKPEGKTIDPREKREEERRKKRRSQKPEEEESATSCEFEPRHGSNIDFEA